MRISVEFRDVDGVQEELEESLDAFMESHGFCRWASGYNYPERVRDIGYKRGEGNGSDTG